VFLIRDIVLPVRLIFLYHCIHWAGAAQILSQALLKVLPEGVQVNLGWYGTEDPWAGPHLIYPPVQTLFLFLGNRFIALLWKINMSQGLIQGCLSLPLSLCLLLLLEGIWGSHPLGF
jgi:hypothetical protein